MNYDNLIKPLNINCFNKTDTDIQFVDMDISSLGNLGLNLHIFFTNIAEMSEPAPITTIPGNHQEYVEKQRDPLAPLHTFTQRTR